MTISVKFHHANIAGGSGYDARGVGLRATRAERSRRAGSRLAGSRLAGWKLAGWRLAGWRLALVSVVVLGMGSVASVAGAAAQGAAALGAAAQGADSRPYDAKLLRLAELLGTIHYLRELCGAGEGQFWRDTMQELLKSEGSSAIRRARLTRRFNQGYRSYSRTYNVCTPSAQSAIDRFLIEGAELSEALSSAKP